MGESLIFILVIKFGLLGKVAALASYGGGRCRRAWDSRACGRPSPDSTRRIRPRGQLPREGAWPYGDPPRIRVRHEARLPHMKEKDFHSFSVSFALIFAFLIILNGISLNLPLL